MFEVKFSKDVVKFIKNLDKNYQKKIIESFEKLAEQPDSSNLDIKPLLINKIISEYELEGIVFCLKNIRNCY